MKDTKCHERSERKKFSKLLFIIIQITFATDLCLKNGDAFASPACTLDQSVSRFKRVT